MKKGNDKEFAFVVYEPVKRGDRNLDNSDCSSHKKVCNTYSGLYNRGKIFLY